MESNSPQNNLKKSYHSFLSFLKGLDQFGKPVGLTIDGEGEFKTIYGGAASVGIGIYLIRIFVLSFIPVILREIDTS